VADVYRFEGVDSESTRNVLYAKSCARVVMIFLQGLKETPIMPNDERQRAFGDAERVLIELIKFCSLSDNNDPMTREGMPQPMQQSLLCELLVMETAIDIVKTLLEQRKQGNRGSSKQLTKTAKLCQRLMRHILRKNHETCSYAADPLRKSVFIEPLQEQMSHGILAAETLREIFVDNTSLLDAVTVDDILAVLNLIKSQAEGQGRKARYIEFFMVHMQREGSAHQPVADC
jgi:hypothetical protein